MTEEPCSLGDCVVITPMMDGGVSIGSTRREGHVNIDADEWAKFKAEVKAGKYDEPGEA